MPNPAFRVLIASTSAVSAGGTMKVEGHVTNALRSCIDYLRVLHHGIGDRRRRQSYGVSANLINILNLECMWHTEGGGEKTLI